MKKIIISFLIISGIIFTGYAGYVHLVGKSANSDAGGIENDNWDFGGNYSYNDPLGINLGLVSKLVGEIKSDLFGTFYFGTGTSTTPIEFKISTNTTLCGAGKVVFDISGNIEPANPVWPPMSFTGNSYYCPGSNSWSGTVYSDLLGYKQLGNTNINPTVLNLALKSKGAIYNKDTLIIQGIVGRTKNSILDSNFNIGNTLNTANGNSQQSIFVDVGVNKGQLDLLVNKNIALLTKVLTPINNNNNNTSITDLTGNQKIYYYNYEGQTDASFSNENNKGKILKIGNSSYVDPGINYQVGVSGKKTIIVKGGNIYINADIYNTNDTTSLLVLVAKRDSTNNKNGGNIYINPNVTNIDAVLIADGSVINYDGSVVTTTTSSLMKQLYIYGSLFTKNSIGGVVNPYGSDGYIKYGKNNSTLANKYDLTKLRHFSLILSPSTGTCTDINSYLIPRDGPTSTGAIEYAWAGKRKCFNEQQGGTADSVVNNLRGTNKFNPVIIRYNPAVKTNPPKILIK